MDMKTYSTRAIAFVRQDLDSAQQLNNAALGIGGEAGEAVDLVKKFLFHDKPLDRTKLLTELGDLAWYINLALYAVGSSWDEITDANIAKLVTRYHSGGFTAEHANSRDLFAEEAAVAESLL